MARYKVVCGNMLDVLAKETTKFDFCFADAPFNIGQEYVGFSDKMSEADYEAFTDEWTWAAWDALTPTGVLALHGNDEMTHLFLENMRDHGLNAHRIGWVIWHYRFGQHQDGNWINSHCHCLIYARSVDEYTWNPDAVLVESDRRSTYADPRIGQSPRGGMRVPLTVWGVPSDGPGWGRVQGNNRERRDGHPNQLPERYLRRLILAYTNPGDFVLDPFGGSGTTATVAVSSGRNAMTIDISEESCKSIEARIKKGAVSR